MAKDIKPRFTLKSVDDIFSTQEMRDEEKLERVREIALLKSRAISVLQSWHRHYCKWWIRER